MKQYLASLIIIIFATTVAYSQVVVKGNIKDDLGMPLIGANVIIAGTTQGVVTDLEGNFEIEVPSKESVLEISYVGLLTKNITVGEQTFIDVQMESDALALDEIVVLGYGRVAKSNVIGSIASVKAEDIQDRPVGNLSQALQGKAAGVSVTNNSGAPGEGTTLRIRGTGTINNSEPLYVIDGIISSGMDHINSSDIESFEILKDAATSAIYGARGANGVIIINTKKGKEGELRVNLDYSYGMQNFENNIEVMDGYDWNIYRLISESRYDDARIRAAQDRASYLSTQPSFNWLDEITRTGQVHKASLSLTQGGEKINYYASIGMFDNQGMIINSGFNRNNVSLKISAKPIKRIRLDLKAAYSGTEQQRQASGDGSIFRHALIAAPWQKYDPDNGFMTDNPYRKATQVHKFTFTDRADFSAILNIDILKGLNFETRVGYSYNVLNNEDYTFVEPKYEYEIYPIDDFKRPEITNELNKNGTSSWENILSYNTKINRHSISAMFISSTDEYKKINVKTEGDSYLYNNSRFAYSNQATYSLKTSGEPDHVRNQGFAGNLNYGYDDRYLLEASFRYDGSSLFPENSRWGLFPSVQAAWRISQENFMDNLPWINQLKIRASAGQSGNNRINRNDQYTIYDNGNYFMFGTTQQWVIIDGYAADNIGNQDILWEKTTTYNIGLDYGLFNAIYGSVDYFEKYTSDMLIKVPIVDAAGIEKYPRQNAGDVKNTGLEFNLGISHKIRDFSFGINGNIAFIQNEITRLGDGGTPIYGGDVKNPDLNNVTYSAQGHSIGEFYGYVYDPDDMYYRNTDDVLADAILLSGDKLPNGSQYLGYIKYLDLNGDGKLDDQDKTFIGSPLPDYYGGAGLNLGYKGFKFDMFWQFQVGNEVFNVLKYWLDVGATNESNNGMGNGELSNKRKSNIGDYVWGVNSSVEPGVDGYYTPDDLQTGTLPSVASTSDGIQNQFKDRPSIFFIEDGSYVRLKDVTLSYSFDKALLEKFKVKSLRIYISGNNLLTFTNYSGLDPEIGSIKGEAESNINMGIDYGTYPQARTYTFGINLGF